MLVNEPVIYQEKLFDERWKEKRREILERDNHKCVFCSSSEHLQVHHRQYHFDQKKKKHVDPWEYDNIYLVTVCEKCHSKGHSRWHVPIFEI